MIINNFKIFCITKFFFQYKNLNLFYIIITIFLSLNCSMKNKNHYDYWETFFLAHEELKRSSFMEGEYEVLFGGLHPDKEAILRKDSQGNLYISASVSKKNDKFIRNLETGNYPNKEDILHIYTTYKFSSFKGRESYIIKRVSHFSAKEYTVIDFLNWYNFISKNIPNDEDIQKSSTYNFLCKYFNCDVVKTDLYLDLLFSPNSNLKEIDILQYTKLKKFLEIASIDLKIFSPGGDNIFQLTNNNKSFKITLPKNLQNQNLGKYQILTNINLNYYGLNINLIDIGYVFEIEKKNSAILLKGYYNKFPEIKITGKLWHILPPEVLNIFIPGNMNNYFKEYFEMLFKGSTGQGNYIELISNVSQGKVDMVVINYSELYRKPFKIFGSPPKKEKSIPVFNNELEKAILEDLR